MEKAEIIQNMYISQDKTGYIWALTQENLSSLFANNKCADQPVHRRSLISALDIRFLESIISKLATTGISIF